MQNQSTSKYVPKRENKIIAWLNKNKNPYTIVVGTILILYAISLLLPLIWALFTSFKTQFMFDNLDKIGLAGSKFSDLTFENYKAIFTDSSFRYEVVSSKSVRNVGFPEMYLYSFIYALGCAFTATAAPCLMGYATAKFPNKFSKLITIVVIFCMVLPIVGSLPSEIQMAVRFGIYDNLFGMLILKANFLSMYFLIFQNVFKGLPKTFDEAAKIDGASNFRVFFSIMMPLVSKTFFTIILLRFIEYWNDYQTPLIYLKSWPTAAFGVYRFMIFDSSTYTVQKLAGAIVLMLPILILFVAFRERIMGNVTMGGIKE